MVSPVKDVSERLLDWVEQGSALLTAYVRVLKGKGSLFSTVDEKETLHMAPVTYSYFPAPGLKETNFPQLGPSSGWMWSVIALLLVFLLGHS